MRGLRRSEGHQLRYARTQSRAQTKVQVLMHPRSPSRQRTLHIFGLIICKFAYLQLAWRFRTNRTFVRVYRMSASVRSVAILVVNSTTRPQALLLQRFPFDSIKIKKKDNSSFRFFKMLDNLLSDFIICYIIIHIASLIYITENFIPL